MTKFRSALAATAAAGLGLSAFATSAYAAPSASPTAKPTTATATPRATTAKATTPAAKTPAATPKASVTATATPTRTAKPRAWVSDLLTATTNKATLQGVAGETYTITGSVKSESTAATDRVNATLNFNAAPADFVSCTATEASNGGAISVGKIVWSTLPANTTSYSTFTIICTLNRNITTADIARDSIAVTNSGSAQAPTGSFQYTINGSVAPSPTPSPTAPTTPPPSATPTPTPTPTPTGQYQPGDWWVGFGQTSIDPKLISPRAGSTYAISGKLDILAYQATTGFELAYNPAPGNGAVSCTATGSNGAVATPGKLTWSGLKVADRLSVDYKITCTYTRDHQTPINEKLTLSAPAHVFSGNVPLVDRDTIDYTVGGQLPNSTGGQQSPVADKDSTGGLAKTGR